MRYIFMEIILLLKSGLKDYVNILKNMEYKSFLKRFDEINQIEDEEEQFKELCLLDDDIQNWIHKKYPELRHFEFEAISDFLGNSEYELIDYIIKAYITTDDMLLENRSFLEIIDNYIKSRI